MLELRPSCEHCEKPLPPDATDARICSFECTFCADCVEQVLSGVCPNCGGNFVPRPIRPAQDWNGRGNTLANNPARTAPKHRRVDAEAHRQLLDALGDTPPEAR
jgi:hypothetical protein